MFPLRSKVTTVGRQASGARALWRATGTKENDFGKPIVAIANSYTQFVPGHVHLKNVVLVMIVATAHVVSAQLKTEVNRYVTTKTYQVS